MKLSSFRPRARPSGKRIGARSTTLDAPTMGGARHSRGRKRARIEPGEVDDVVIGAAMQQGSTGYNVGRQCAIAPRACRP